MSAIPQSSSGSSSTGPVPRPDATAGAQRVLAGRYRLAQRRGAGVDIAIFEALDERTDEVVAVKLVHPDIVAEEGFPESFESVMQQVAAIDHPNVARVRDHGVADWNGRCVAYVVNENLTGGSLRDLLDRGRTLSPSQAVVVGLDACRALDVAHRLGIVHGDVRPSNLVFGADGRLRLVDLGLAGLVSRRLWDDPVGVSIDRARYASPEQATGAPAQARSDVYSLCLTLIESLRGAVPFTGDSTVATLANRVDKLMPVSADMGPLASVLARAGLPDPEERFTAADLGRALVQVAERLPRPARLPLPGMAAGDSPVAAVAPGAVEGARAAGDDVADGVGARPADAAMDPGTGDVGAGALVASSTEARDRDLPRAAGSAAEDEPEPEPEPEAEPEAEGDGTPAGGALPPPPVGARPVDPSGPVPRPPVDAATAAGSGRPAGAGPTGGATPATAAGPAGTVGAGSTAGAPDAAGPLLRDPRSRWRLLGYVALAAVCAALGAGLFLLVEPLLDGDTTNDVPELVGVEQGEALNAISGFGWDVLLLSEESDDVEAGDVLRTEPAAGAELDEGDDFTLVVSSGPAPRVLPEITGATLEQATAALEALDLTLEVAEQRNDDAVPAGVVLEWVVPDQPALAAGATVVRGTVVRVVVSSGPAPRVVPDLTGLSPADATARLEAEGLVVAVLPEEFSPRVPAGAVARQDPPPGSSLQRGATVSIVISKGQDLVVVPPLADLTQQQVADTLAAAGLVLGAVTGDEGGVAVLAQVDGTSIGAGISLPRGTPVDVTFAVPPPPETAPPETAPAEAAAADPAAPDPATATG